MKVRITKTKEGYYKKGDILSVSACSYNDRYHYILNAELKRIEMYIMKKDCKRLYPYSFIKNNSTTRTD